MTGCDSSDGDGPVVRVKEVIIVLLVFILLFVSIYRYTKWAITLGNNWNFYFKLLLGSCTSTRKTTTTANQHRATSPASRPTNSSRRSCKKCHYFKFSHIFSLFSSDWDATEDSLYGPRTIQKSIGGSDYPRRSIDYPKKPKDGPPKRSVSENNYCSTRPRNSLKPDDVVKVILPGRTSPRPCLLYTSDAADE